MATLQALLDRVSLAVRTGYLNAGLEEVADVAGLTESERDAIFVEAEADTRQQARAIWDIARRDVCNLGKRRVANESLHNMLPQVQSKQPRTERVFAALRAPRSFADAGPIVSGEEVDARES